MAKPQFIMSGEEGKFTFLFKGPNHEILLTSEHFEIRQSCVSAVVACKLHAQVERNFQKLKTRSGKYFFNLRTVSKEIIATSPEYDTLGHRELAIQTIKTYANDAELIDRTGAAEA